MTNEDFHLRAKLLPARPIKNFPNRWKYRGYSHGPGNTYRFLQILREHGQEVRRIQRAQREIDAANRKEDSDA